MNMAKHKWVHEHGFVSESESYDQYRCRKCKIIKRNLIPKYGKLIKVLVQGNGRLSTPVPLCTGYKFIT